MLKSTLAEGFLNVWMQFPLALHCSPPDLPLEPLLCLLSYTFPPIPPTTVSILAQVVLPVAPFSASPALPDFVFAVCMYD